MTVSRRSRLRCGGGAVRAAFVVALLAFLALSGCRTTPPAPPAALAEYLPDGARSYVYLEVARAQEPARRILEAVAVHGRNLDRILERTERVAAAFGVPEAGADVSQVAGGEAAAGRYVVAASGRIPGFFVEARLEDEREWEERPVVVRSTRYGIWRRIPEEGEDALELVFPAPRVALVGTAGLESALQGIPYRSAPGVGSARTHAAVVAVPQMGLQAPFGAGIIELRNVELRGDIDPADGRWHIGGTMELTDERTARAVTALIRLFAVSTISQLGADPEEAAAELEVERSGERIDIDGIVLSERFVIDAVEQFLLRRGGGNP